MACAQGTARPRHEANKLLPVRRLDFLCPAPRALEALRPWVSHPQVESGVLPRAEAS